MNCDVRLLMHANDTRMMFMEIVDGVTRSRYDLCIKPEESIELFDKLISIVKVTSMNPENTLVINIGNYELIVTCRMQRVNRHDDCVIEICCKEKKFRQSKLLFHKTFTKYQDSKTMLDGIKEAKRLFTEGK